MDKQTKLAVDSGEMLPLMEAFYTIQGEGYYSGTAAYFLRIGGCDVGCHWCDVKDSWDANKHPMIEVSDVLEELYGKSIDTVVITGGEPLMWNLDYLCNKLKDLGLAIHLETSGAYPMSGSFDWICISPKKNQDSLLDILKIADELKIIVHNKNDLKWAKNKQNSVSKSCKLYLQPEWKMKNKVMPYITDFIMENIQWEVSLQTHKYMNLP